MSGEAWQKKEKAYIKKKIQVKFNLLPKDILVKD